MEKKDKKLARSSSRTPAPLTAEEKESLKRCYVLAEHLRLGCTHKEAMAAAGIGTWDEVHRIYQRSPEFKEAYKAAKIAREDIWKIERLETAHQRAVYGVKRAVTSPRDGIIGYDLYPSDRMMEILLRKDDPEGFSERVKTEHTGSALVNLLLDIESRSLPPQPTPKALPDATTP